MQVQLCLAGLECGLTRSQPEVQISHRVIRLIIVIVLTVTSRNCTLCSIINTPILQVRKQSQKAKNLSQVYKPPLGSLPTQGSRSWGRGERGPRKGGGSPVLPGRGTVCGRYRELTQQNMLGRSERPHSAGGKHIGHTGHQGAERGGY